MQGWWFLPHLNLTYSRNSRRLVQKMVRFYRMTLGCHKLNWMAVIPVVLLYQMWICHWSKSHISWHLCAVECVCLLYWIVNTTSSVLQPQGQVPFTVVPQCYQLSSWVSLTWITSLSHKIPRGNSYGREMKIRGFRASLWREGSIFCISRGVVALEYWLEHGYYGQHLEAKNGCKENRIYMDATFTRSGLNWGQICLLG